MAGEIFWNNRELAQKQIEEVNSLRGRIDPLLKAEKELEDFGVMVELGEAEPDPSRNLQSNGIWNATWRPSSSGSMPSN